MEKMAISNMFDISGCTALVTGGRRGLGLAVSEGLALAGADVAVAARSPDHEELSRRMDATGAQFEYFPVDLADRESRSDLIDAVVDKLGKLDILVNCAGSQHREPAIDFSLGKWDELVSLMLTGVFELCQAAARHMSNRGGGRIVNIASLASFQGGWTIPAYAAAKHGVAGLTKALANEWAGMNINVNAIAPGYFKTDMCAGIINDPEREPRIRERIPAGRWGQPEDLVGSVIFLASDASKYVHGHTLVVDGGWMGR